MFNALDFLKPRLFKCFKRILILKVDCLILRIGRQLCMQFLIDLSNTALELKKAGLQFFSDILVSVHLPPCTCVLQMRIASRPDIHPERAGYAETCSEMAPSALHWVNRRRSEGTHDVLPGDHADQLPVGRHYGKTSHL